MWQGRGKSDRILLSHTWTVSPFTHVSANDLSLQTERYQNQSPNSFLKDELEDFFQKSFFFLKKKKEKTQNFEIEFLLRHRAWGKAMNVNLGSKDPENFEKKTEYTTVYVIRTPALASKVNQRVLRHCNPFSFIVASISTVKNTFVYLFCIDGNSLLSHQTLAVILLPTYRNAYINFNSYM